MSEGLATPTLTPSNPGSSVVGQSITYGATVSGLGAVSRSTGNVTFSVGVRSCVPWLFWVEKLLRASAAAPPVAPSAIALTQGDSNGPPSLMTAAPIRT